MPGEGVQGCACLCALHICVQLMSVYVHAIYLHLCLCLQVHALLHTSACCVHAVCMHAVHVPVCMHVPSALHVYMCMYTLCIFAVSTRKYTHLWAVCLHTRVQVCTVLFYVLCAPCLHECGVCRYMLYTCIMLVCILGHVCACLQMRLHTVCVCAHLLSMLVHARGSCWGVCRCATCELGNK